MGLLYLLRHCETDHAAEKRYCGFSDPPLNDNGKLQAESLRDRMNGARIDRVYSSDLQRCVQTAEIVFNGSHIEQSEDLRELNFDIFEGMNYDEIIKRHPDLYRSWVNDPLRLKVAHVENLKELSVRVKKRLGLILYGQGDDNIAIVTHGGPIRVIICKVMGYGLDKFWQVGQGLGALNIINYPEGGKPSVVKINDISHIRRDRVTS